MEQLHQIIVNSQSMNKADRDQATQQLQNIKLDGGTAQVLVEYIKSDQVGENYRQMAAI